MNQTPPTPARPLGSGHPHVRAALTVSEPRLTRLLQRDPTRCASLSEYAKASGIDITRILDLLGPALESGSLTFEPVGAEIFVHTAPNGRPTPTHLPELPPNLWEQLREGRARHHAYALWQLVRSLEDAGWEVTADPKSILSPLLRPPRMHVALELGLMINHRVHPLLVRPDLPGLAGPYSPIGTLADAGAHAVAFTIDSGSLDEAVTAVRKLHLHGVARNTVILILEAPRFAPLLLTSADTSVAPKSVTLTVLGEALG